MKKNVVFIIVAFVLLCLYTFVHIEVEEYLYVKTEIFVDLFFEALCNNIWFVCLIELLEAYALIAYIRHYCHDISLRIGHIISFVTLIILLFITDENWDLISSNYLLLSFSDITKMMAFFGILFNIGCYYVNGRKDIDNDLTSPNSLEENRKKYAKTIVDSIIKENNSAGSFAIGICGGWGSGKTR